MSDRTSISATRLRILIVVPYDLAEPGGGVKHHALGLARVLRARGDTVMVAGPTSKPVQEPHMVGFRGVVNVQFNGSANRIGLFVNPLAVRRFLRRHRFDIIHVRTLSRGLPYWIAWLSKSVCKICTFHAYAEHPSLSLRVGQRLSAPGYCRITSAGWPYPRRPQSLCTESGVGHFPSSRMVCTPTCSRPAP